MVIYLYLSGQSQCLFFFQIIYFTSEYFKYNENKKYNSFVFKTLFEVSTIKRWGFCTKKKKHNGVVYWIFTMFTPPILIKFYSVLKDGSA